MTEIEIGRGKRGRLAYGFDDIEIVPSRRTRDPRGVSLGWQIDADGRYWHNGGTAGHHAFVGFDTKTRRGVVLLAGTSTSLIDAVAVKLYKVLAGADPNDLKVYKQCRNCY